MYIRGFHLEDTGPQTFSKQSQVFKILLLALPENLLFWIGVHSGFLFQRRYIYTKLYIPSSMYYKHWLFTLAYTIDCVCFSLYEKKTPSNVGYFKQNYRNFQYCLVVPIFLKKQIFLQDWVFIVLGIYNLGCVLCNYKALNLWPLPCKIYWTKKAHPLKNAKMKGFTVEFFRLCFYPIFFDFLALSKSK